MRFGQATAHADEVHDREHPGFPVIVFLGRPVIGKQPADIVVGAIARRRPRRDQRVDAPLVQMLGQGFIIRQALQLDAFGGLYLDRLAPSRLLEAAAAPAHVGRLDAVLVLKDSPHP